MRIAQNIFSWKKGLPLGNKRVIVYFNLKIHVLEKRKPMSEKDEEEKKSAPFLPYDITLKDNFHIYDNSTYYRNKDKTEDFPMMSSGKIIKSYEQNLSDEKKEIKHEE